MPRKDNKALSNLIDLMNSAKWVDLSPLIENDMPRWPTHPPRCHP